MLKPNCHAKSKIQKFKRSEELIKKTGWHGGEGSH
jgi:hypothetical protein